MERELTMEQKQLLAKCIKQLQLMQKKVDKISADIDGYDDCPLDCAYFTIGETIEYLEKAITVY